MEIEGGMAKDPRERMKKMIDKGLRARMALQSIVTGSSLIEIDFLPGTPVRLTGLDPAYIEIPTLRSPINKLAQKLENLPVEKIADKLVDILDNLDNLLKDPEIKALVKNLNTDSQKLEGLIENADRLVLNVDGEVGQISESLQKTLTDVQKALKDASMELNGVASDARNLLLGADRQIKPVMRKIQTALDSANNAMAGAKKTLVTLDGFVGENSGTRHQLNRALEAIAAAATSIKSLMDYLERHPNALLIGKGVPK